MAPPKGSLDQLQNTAKNGGNDASAVLITDANANSKSVGRNTDALTPEQHVAKAKEYLGRLDKHADKKAEDVIKVKLGGKEQEMTVGEFRQRVVNGANAEFNRAVLTADTNLLATAARVKELSTKSNKTQQETTELEALKESHAPAWKARVEHAGFLGNLGQFDAAQKRLMEVVQEPIVWVVPADKQQPIVNFYNQLSTARVAVAAGTSDNTNQVIPAPAKVADAAPQQQTEAQRASAEFVKHFGAFEDAAKSNNFELAKKELDAAAQVAQKIDTKNETVFALKHAPAFVEFTRAGIEQAMNNHAGAKEILDKIKAQDPEFAQAADVKFEDRYKISADKLSTMNKVKDVGTDMLCGLVSMGAGLVAGVAAAETVVGAPVAAVAAASATYTGLKAYFQPNDVHWYTPVIGAFNGLGGAMFAPAKTLVAEGTANLLGRTVVRSTAGEYAAGQLSKIGGTELVEQLVAREGVAAGYEAQKLAAQSLAKSGEGMGFMQNWFGWGNAARREALSAYRNLQMYNLSSKFTGNIAGALTTSTALNVPRGYLTGEYQTWEEFKQKGAQRVAGDAGMVLLGGHLLPALGSGLAKIPAVTTAMETAPKVLPYLMTNTAAAMTPSAMHAYDSRSELSQLKAPPKNNDEIRQVYQSLPGMDNILGH